MNPIVTEPRSRLILRRVAAGAGLQQFHRRSLAPWAKVTQKKVDDALAVLQLDGGAPTAHFVQFALPLAARQSLPRDHIFPVTPDAGALHLRRERRNRRRRVGRSSRISNLDPYLRYYVP